MDASTRDNRTTANHESVRRKKIHFPAEFEDNVIYALLIWNGNIRRLSQFFCRLRRVVPLKNS
jgi:hypothetical protein